jgi:general secretion pathway protein D
MNQFTRYLILCSTLLSLCNVFLDARYPQEKHTPPQEHKEADTIPFSYTNEDIVNIINHLSGVLGKNVLLPQGANSINIKLTYISDLLLTPPEAWDLLLSFLDTAGYSVIEKNDTFQIIKSNKEIAREGLPVYIGTDITHTRDADQRIMYVHYFTNMRALNEGSGEVQELLKSMLPEDAKYVTDPSKNALIIAARAHDIFNLLDVIAELDKSDFKEKIYFTPPLRYAEAQVVANLFNEHFLPQEDTLAKYRLDTRKRSESSFFAPHTRIIGYERTNSLILIGNEQGVSRIKEFINKHIDVAPDSGESVLHVYRLQYLDAEEFVPVLQKIVDTSNSGTGQSRTEGKRPTGPERFFDEVIVNVDKPKNAQELKYYGGNNLVIACQNDDWKVIRELIESLDLPQDQVFIEILIADLTVNDSRLLGSLMRNPAAFPLFNQIEFQSAQLAPGVVVSPLPIVPTSNVNGDILPITTDGCTVNNTSFDCNTTIGAMTPGSTAISFSDSNGATWNISQILKLFSHSKIITHPHVVATHNKETQFITGQYRLVQGDVTGSIGSNTVIKQEPITADLKIFITPRISGTSTVNLDVKIDIEEFIPGPANAKATRTVKTNANVTSETILTLGGLIRTQSSQGLSQTPVLGDIPILGWFFKSRSGDLAKNNLTVFISPTIVHARLRKGIGDYTQDYVALAEQYSAESMLFDSVREPITRLFFRSDLDTYKHELQQFVESDEFIQEETIVPIPNIDDGSIREDSAPVTPNENTNYAFDKEKNSSPHNRPMIAKARRVRKKKTVTKSPSLILVDENSAQTRLKDLLHHDTESPFAKS